MDIKELAYHKVRAKYESKVREVSANDQFWSIDKDRAEQFNERVLLEADVYNYLLTLIEKDRT